MPLFNDIYIATNDRSKACIDRFISKYADLTTDKANANYFDVLNGDECIETGTLEATINYALGDTRRSSVIYLDSIFIELKSVIIFFASDGKLVFGLSIDHNDQDGGKEAEHVLSMLKTEFSTTLGVISLETPPGEAYKWIIENSEQL